LILHTKVDEFVKEIFMADRDQEKLKAEIDGIIKNIDNTMKKIENIIPAKQDVPDGTKSDTCEKLHDSLPKK
jgi:hypothetical protein